MAEMIDQKEAQECRRLSAEAIGKMTENIGCD
jgi:hypothetical protein